jgi:hypothetical protein
LNGDSRTEFPASTFLCPLCPYKIFKELRLAVAWRQLMNEWRSLAERNRMEIEAFKKLLKD